MRSNKISTKDFRLIQDALNDAIVNLQMTTMNQIDDINVMKEVREKLEKIINETYMKSELCNKTV